MDSWDKTESSLFVVSPALYRTAQKLRPGKNVSLFLSLLLHQENEEFLRHQLLQCIRVPQMIPVREIVLPDYKSHQAEFSLPACSDCLNRSNHHNEEKNFYSSLRYCYKYDLSEKY